MIVLMLPSSQSIPAGESLSTVVVHGASLGATARAWGRVLQLSSGLERVKERSGDVVTNYLGWWNDNGAFYYYHTLPNMNYEVTSGVVASKCFYSSSSGHNIDH